MPELQRQEERQDPASGLVDCPGCPKCEPNDGLILKINAGRPTQATEKLYLFSRSPRYFYDAEAVREPHVRTWDSRNGGSLKGGSRYTEDAAAPTAHQRQERYPEPNPAGRNLRNWWEIATEPYPEAHFATYPQELVRRCILAGTSERGCCPECGAAWVREVEFELVASARKPDKRAYPSPRGDGSDGDQGAARSSSHVAGLSKQGTTLGWRPSCDHFATDDNFRAHHWEPIACTVLDPFFGSGTTGLVARKHGRRTIGIELSPEYCGLAARRLSQLSLLAEPA